MLMLPTVIGVLSHLQFPQCQMACLDPLETFLQKNMKKLQE